LGDGEKDSIRAIVFESENRLDEDAVIAYQKKFSKKPREGD
jgi:hypothetical protein